MFPAVGSRQKSDPACWVVLRLEVRATRSFFSATVWPTSVPELRMRTIERLTRERKEFGFRLFLKTTSDSYTQLGREAIDAWTEADGPDEEGVLAKVRAKLDELQSRLAGVPAALKPLFDEAYPSQPDG